MATRDQRAGGTCAAASAVAARHWLCRTDQYGKILGGGGGAVGKKICVLERESWSSGSGPYAAIFLLASP